MHPTIDSSEKFSRDKVSKIRDALTRVLHEKPYTVVTGGSFARGEASTASDLDWFLVCESETAKATAQKDRPSIEEILTKLVPKSPSADGAFGQIESIDEMVLNIGGDHDLNHKITRRILFLLEGEYLLDKGKFDKYRDRVLEKYISEKISEHQFCRFLLNDLIRYYRTICVDFEHKTTEAGKAWGIRNIKLIFSRKLLYFSGIIVAAETWQHTHKTKVAKAKSLLALSPVRRIQSVCGASANLALEAYDDFLLKLGDPVVREMLESVNIRGKQPEDFRVFKNEGHHFSWLLAKLLKDKYDTSHPIHNALIV